MQKKQNPAEWTHQGIHVPEWCGDGVLILLNNNVTVAG